MTDTSEIILKFRGYSDKEIQQSSCLFIDAPTTTEQPTDFWPRYPEQPESKLNCESMPTSVQNEIAGIGNTLLERIWQSLGVDPSLVTVFQSLLRHLNDQNTGKKDRFTPYKEFRKKILVPQRQALVEILREHLTQEGWEVGIDELPMVGDMQSLVLTHRGDSQRSLRVYADGFSMETPDFKLNWNIYSLPIDSQQSSASGVETDVWFSQRAYAENELVANLRMIGVPRVLGEGKIVIDRPHGRQSRSGPLEQFVPTTAAYNARAAYNGSGEMKSLLLSAKPPTETGTFTQLRVYFDFGADFSEKGPNLDKIPITAAYMSGNQVRALPWEPLVTVTPEKMLRVSYLGREDEFPLRVADPVSQAHTVAEVVLKYLQL